MRTHRTLLLLQGIYYVITGIWPIVHLPSFEGITGKKAERFTLHATGVLIAIIGAVVGLAARDRRPAAEASILAIASAVGLGGIEIAYIGRVRLVYQMEALLEFLLAGLLVVTRRDWWTRKC